MARLAALLLLVGTALLAIGVVVERKDNAHAEPTGAHRDGGSAGDAGEAGAGHHEASAAVEGADSGERVLGINTESTTSVAAAVLVSLVAAASLWLTAKRRAAIAVVVIGAAFAVFDTAEVAHQLSGSRRGLAALAATVALAHLSAAVAAGRYTTATRSTPGA